MERLKTLVPLLSKFMGIIAGITLMFVMFLTVLDVILRYFGRPIIGVYDLVALGGAIVIGFSMPLAAAKKVHVFMGRVAGTYLSYLRNRGIGHQLG
jgi:TRAP-type C4-dicarboxylate transport system permease small subunit